MDFGLIFGLYQEVIAHLIIGEYFKLQTLKSFNLSILLLNHLNIMRRIFTPAILLIIICLACDSNNVGPQGPRGPQGPAGIQGEPGEIGYVFEYENIDFEADNYEFILPLPSDFETFASDVILVYLLWGIETIDGVDFDIWRPLPQTVFVPDQGTLVYNFDFIQNDVRLFLSSDFPLDSLTDTDTDDWIARVVVVPAEFWNSSRINFNKYDEVATAMGLTEMSDHKDIRYRR